MTEHEDAVRILKPWYKDRDFPEIKTGNDDIVAVVTDVAGRDRLIIEHNALIQKVRALAVENEKFKETLNNLSPSLVTGDKAWDVHNLCKTNYEQSIALKEAEKIIKYARGNPRQAVDMSHDYTRWIVEWLAKHSQKGGG